jgi:hypothetical protein
VIGDVGGLISGKFESNIELWRVDCGELGTEDANSDGGFENPAQLFEFMGRADGPSFIDEDNKGGAVGE